MAMSKTTIFFSAYNDDSISGRLNRLYGYNGLQKGAFIPYDIMNDIINDKADVINYDKCIDIYSDEGIQHNGILIGGRLWKVFEGILSENMDTVIRFGVFKDNGRHYIKVYSYDGIYFLISGYPKALNGDVMKHVAGRFRFSYFETNK